MAFVLVHFKTICTWECALKSLFFLGVCLLGARWISWAHQNPPPPKTQTDPRFNIAPKRYPNQDPKCNPKGPQSKIGALFDPIWCPICVSFLGPIWGPFWDPIWKPICVRVSPVQWINHSGSFFVGGALPECWPGPVAVRGSWTLDCSEPANKIGNGLLGLIDWALGCSGLEIRSWTLRVHTVVTDWGAIDWTLDCSGVGGGILDTCRH